MRTIQVESTSSVETYYKKHFKLFESVAFPDFIPLKDQIRLLQEYKELGKLQGRSVTKSEDPTNGQRKRYIHIERYILILEKSIQKNQEDTKKHMKQCYQQFMKTKSTESIPLDIQKKMLNNYKDTAERLAPNTETHRLHYEYVNILEKSINEFVQFQVAILDPLFKYTEEKITQATSEEEETHHTSPEILSFYESVKEYLNEFKRRMTSLEEENDDIPHLADFIKERKSETFLNWLKNFLEGVAEQRKKILHEVNENSHLQNLQAELCFRIFIRESCLFEDTLNEMFNDCRIQLEQTKSIESISLVMQE